MSATLHREFVLDNELRWNAAKAFVDSNRIALAASNSPIRLIVTTQEEKRRQEQNRYYWGVVIKSIAEQAWVGGRQFDSDAWHEQQARTFGILQDVKLPNGEIVQKRLSTTEMSVKEFAHYTEQVTAWAAAELGIRFPAQEVA